MPIWLLKHLDLLDTPVTFWTYDQVGQAGSPRAMHLGNLQAVDVCGPCNGGWMNDLEQAVIGLLPSLIRGEQITVASPWTSEFS